MPLDLSLAERETGLSLMADDRTTWIVHSNDPWFWRKMAGLGIEPVYTLGYETRVYHLDAHTVSFRKKMQLSDDERARRAVVVQAARRQRRSTVNSQSADAQNE